MWFGLMKRSADYKTKQRDAILKFIESLEDAHVTAAQIAEHFEKEGVAIGRTTIYRHLERLTERGELRKYTTDGVSGACYQSVSDGRDCEIHLHLKCEGCGELKHMECDTFNEIKHHVFSHHDFEVDAYKTVLYGKCGDCLNKSERPQPNNP